MKKKQLSALITLAFVSIGGGITPPMPHMMKISIRIRWMTSSSRQSVRRISSATRLQSSPIIVRAVTSKSSHARRSRNVITLI